MKKRKDKKLALVETSIKSDAPLLTCNLGAIIEDDTLFAGLSDKRIKMQVESISKYGVRTVAVTYFGVALGKFHVTKDGKVVKEAVQLTAKERV